MKTTVRMQPVTRWKGTVSDILSIANRASESIAEDTGTPPSCFVKVTLADIETHFDRLSDFETSVQEDLGQVETVELTIGDFLQDSASSAQIEFRQSPTAAAFRQGRTDAAVTVKVRGHNSRLVDGLVAELTRLAAHGRRRFALSMSAITWIAIVVYLVAQFVFFETVELPSRMSDLATYLMFALIGGLPFAFMFAVVWTVNWLVPVLELLPPATRTRWERMRHRVIAGVVSLVTLIAAPLLVALLSDLL